jgi:nucleoside-diphosphate-sugar epimerase
MIFGSGAISLKLKNIDNENVVFFTSLINNSQEQDIDLYKRDMELLQNIIGRYPDKLIIFYSTASIYDKSKQESLYVRHKLNLESILRKKHNSYLILRITNEVGNGGADTLLLNYIAKCFKENLVLKVYKLAYRNLIDVDDVIGITNNILQIEDSYNKTLNIGYIHNYSMPTIADNAHVYFGNQIQIEYLNLGDTFEMEMPKLVWKYFEDKKQLNKDQYIRSLFEKYF